jgi:hypothetical protein
VIDSGGDGEIEEIGGGSRTSFANWPNLKKKGDKVAGSV